MAELREFDLATVLSLTTGVLMTHDGKTFSDVHELAEFVAGRPLWTHQFASEELWNELSRAVHTQHPWVQPLTEDFARLPLPSGGPENLSVILGWRDEQDCVHPGPVTLVRGVDGRTYDDLVTAAVAELDQLAGTRPVVVVKAEQGGWSS